MNKTDDIILKCPYCKAEVVAHVSKKGKDDIAKGKKAIFTYICRECGKIVVSEFKKNPGQNPPIIEKVKEKKK